MTSIRMGLGSRTLRSCRGISLLELLAAMSTASLVMAAATALVHRAISTESRARIMRTEERTALRLGRRFRADVHEGRVTARDDDGAEASLLTLHGPAGSIDYRPVEGGLMRLARPVGGRETREAFLFHRPMAWTSGRDGRLVMLRGTTADHTTTLPPTVIELMATDDPGDDEPAAEMPTEGGSP